MKEEKILEWIGTLCSFTGCYLNAQLNIWGFVIWTFGNLFWMTLAIKRRMWGMLFTFAAFTVFNVIGFYHWMSMGYLGVLGV